MEKITWGIIGCGDVAEVKSGPALQQCEHSELLAVMRRDGEKAKDFAYRHNVPHWYDTAEALLKNDNINAVYIATPPAFHLAYTLKAIEAGKHIYLEKPMAFSAEEAQKIVAALQGKNNKLTVAHYRRKLPAFLKVKALLAENAIGEVRLADIQILQPPKSDMIATTEENWRVDPRISGGGLFYDLAPHQLDLMFNYFGEIEHMQGFCANQAQNYAANDMVNGLISFKNGVQFRGVWAFNVSGKNKKDECTIYGSEGSIRFSFYGDQVHLNSTAKN